MQKPIFVINEQLLQEIVNYLIEKPFREVNTILSKIHSEVKTYEQEDWERFLNQKEESQND